jgi:hypothetical protein
MKQTLQFETSKNNITIHTNNFNYLDKIPIDKTVFISFRDFNVKGLR